MLNILHRRSLAYLIAIFLRLYIAASYKFSSLPIIMLIAKT